MTPSERLGGNTSIPLSELIACKKKLQLLLKCKSKLLQGDIPEVLEHFDEEQGLCYNYFSRTHLSQYSKNLFTKWKHFSGNLDFPIMLEGEYSPSEIYFESSNLYVGEYGRLRFKLAKYILKYIKKDIIYLKSLENSDD